LDLARCLEEVESALDDLINENKNIPVIVEGRKDQRALRKLGLDGIIIMINTGMSLSDFSDWISDRYDHVIILSDWDRRGGSLCRRLKELLHGRIQLNLEIRQRLSTYAMIKKVEGLPSWLETVRQRLEEVSANHVSSSKRKISSMDD